MCYDVLLYGLPMVAFKSWREKYIGLMRLAKPKNFMFVPKIVRGWLMVRLVQSNRLTKLKLHEFTYYHVKKIMISLAKYR
jgi:hypothetical protein